MFSKFKQFTQFIVNQFSEDAKLLALGEPFWFCCWELKCPWSHIHCSWQLPALSALLPSVASSSALSQGKIWHFCLPFKRCSFLRHLPYGCINWCGWRSKHCLLFLFLKPTPWWRFMLMDLLVAISMIWFWSQAHIKSCQNNVLSN